MLVDSYVLTKGFEELITLGSSTSSAAPAGYVKRVSQTMSRLSPLLKTLQVRPSPPEALVQAYLIHVADKSDTNFRKILDLKGIRKQDQGQLVELFIAHRSGPRHESLPQYSAFLTPLVVNSSTPNTGAAGLGSANLHTLQGRFDPAHLGSAIMTAARDGVDRLGTPALGGSSGTASRTQSPPPLGARPPLGGHANTVDLGSSGGNVNQNLRNIGRFFKRDIGSLSGRFGVNKGADDSGR